MWGSVFIFLLWNQINSQNKMFAKSHPCSFPPLLCSGVTEYECDDTTGGKRLVQMGGDVLLGTCTIPLSQLLARHSGEKPQPAVAVPVLLGGSGRVVNSLDCLPGIT